MHTVHLADKPKAGIKYGVIGVMFDTKRYNASINDTQRKVIDRFFDSMKWD